jgi:hypothetical protein
MDTSKNPKKSQKNYYCEVCELYTPHKNDFNKHLLTAKHLRVQREYIKSPKNPEKSHVTPSSFHCICGKIYKYSQGLSKHKIKCSFADNPLKNESTDLAKIPNNSIVPPNLHNNDLLIELIKQNNELQKQIIEMSKEPKTVNNTNNIQFNIHQFLNETCKNAPNFSDFIEQIFEPTFLDFLPFFQKAGIEVLGYNQEMQRFDGGFIPDTLDTDVDMEKTLYVNAWDPWSMIGNGNERDSSLDGHWGRCSNMAVLGWSLTNQAIKYRAI